MNYDYLSGEFILLFFLTITFSIVGVIIKSKHEYIFVQIPSYKDTQLLPTIKSLLENAYNRDRLNIYICWQHDSSERLPKEIIENRNINIIDVDYKCSRGANWARSVLQKKWNNEPYSFLVDSHTRFARNWDKQLIDMMLLLKKKKVKKPIISGLPPSFYNPDTYPSDRLNYPTKIYPKEYPFNLLTRFHGFPLPLYKWLKSPIPAQFIAMGFLFTEGNFNIEIPFDPNIYFFGDDITTALRAYCHGYDLFHPHRIIAWHLYERKTRTPHWQEHENWIDLDKKSYERIYRIFKGESFDEYTTIGSERDVASYETYTGYKLILDEQD